MRDIIIDVGQQLDGFTFRLNPRTRINMKEKRSGVCPASSVFVSYDTRQSFEAVGKSVWKNVAVLLTGLSDSQIRKLGRFVFVNPASGEEIFSSGQIVFK